MIKSQHKHNYEVVLLTGTYQFIHPRTHKETRNQTILPYEICTVCGKLKHVSRDHKYYVRKYLQVGPEPVYEEELSEEALKLPKWFINDFGNFAYPEGALI
jgi:hypothetical protein